MSVLDLTGPSHRYLLFFNLSIRLESSEGAITPPYEVGVWVSYMGIKSIYRPTPCPSNLKGTSQPLYVERIQIMNAMTGSIIITWIRPLAGGTAP